MISWKGCFITPKNILIWEKDIGSFQIAEGDGLNLLPEDEENEYVDYITVTEYEYDGYFKETGGCTVILTSLFQEQFESETDVVKYLINTALIPEAEYTYLYAN